MEMGDGAGKTCGVTTPLVKSSWVACAKDEKCGRHDVKFGTMENEKGTCLLQLNNIEGVESGF